MVKHKSTSGLMLLVMKEFQLIVIIIIISVHVLATNLMVLFHHSLGMTTIVIVELIVNQNLESSTLHHCGLVKDILHQISAAPIVECHGSVRLYLFPLLATLRYVIVMIIQIMSLWKIQPWN